MVLSLRPKKKKLLCCPQATDRKMRKNGRDFLIFFMQTQNIQTHHFREKMSDLSEEFTKIPIQWLKTALLYAFCPFERPIKNIGKLNSHTVSSYIYLHSTVRTCVLVTSGFCCRKKKNRPTDPIFKISHLRAT